MAVRILLVDDEPPILELVSYNLRREGYEVRTARDGAGALEAFRRERPDLVILDLMLPGQDGYQVCRALREEGDVPILMLTARKEEEDRIRGLDLGADDYVTKPFSPRELAARVRAILRRSAGKAPEGGRLRCGDLALDLERRTVEVAGRSVNLTFTEFELLALLARSPGRVYTRELLLEKIWGYDYFGDIRTVDVHIRHLREKIEADPALPTFIETVRGVGYRFREGERP
ncbi:MAG: response regulator transcription factor [Thermaerobacter sp.]|nr:response regulator transcription factor [Thermaerobacter sp.]MDA8146205.1 response regulator transcription factor [Thermaerobacter sp.]